jgi:nitrous oxide reductase accessory protein NosL
MTAERHFMIRRQCLLPVMVVLLCACGAIAGAAREDCRICGMWIDQYLRTRHVLTEADGSQVSFCSFTCAARYLKQKGGEMKLLRAADYLSKELVDARKAIYLVGSDVPPVMSFASIIAFSRKDTATEFQKIHGGRIMSFAELMAEQ